MTHTCAWMHASMQTYIHGPLCVCLLYLSLCLLAFASLYIFVLYHLLCVCMGFTVDAFLVVFCCPYVSLRVLGSLCACSSICTCDQLSPGSLSLCGFCVCTSMSRGSFPSLYQPCLSVDGSRLVIFKPGENDGLARLWCQAAILMTCRRLGLPGRSERLPPSALCSRVLKTR